ncbi:hypothetical protein LTR62_003222 [Meristemomyces frigidus]|uniref:RNI-like protein n=1 Tax=Meristemomyces frigidus TaxID=1508187 RepID=A0AAN7YKX0_9PEZI|nr:hypothetical protein LTR62_003222 [Meristemomyces frigidus]
MAKSNKFDYTKKKNTGVGLGLFIAKQLDSEADAVRRAADRAARKFMTADDESVDKSVTHQIDLKIPSKDLGDDGLAVLCDGLEAALAKGTADASLALEDLDLSGNGITTLGLARLSAVLRKARYDVKTIVLSSNPIVVENDDQAMQWETFLKSFADCQKLRRLDLSANPGLGRRAMEIFAMVHIREPQIDPIRAGSLVSLHSTLHSDSTRTRSGSLSLNVTRDRSPPRNTMAGGRMLTRKCGLRSIPFTSLQQCGLTDAGALWLSYVIEDHYFPIQLVSELNASLADSSIEAYRQDSKVHGIDWSGNDGSLGKDGISLLVKTEAVRKQTVLDDPSSTLAGSSLLEASVMGGTIHTDRKPSSSAVGKRRVSIRSTTTVEEGEGGVTDLDSFRKRVQRGILQHDKPQGTDLWHASLQLLRTVRCLLMAAPITHSIYAGPPLFNHSSGGSPITIVVGSAPPKSKITGRDSPLAIDTAKANLKSTYAGTLLGPHPLRSRSPESTVLTEVSNTPTTPKRVFKAHRKDAFSHGADATTVAEKLTGLGIRQVSSEEYLEYQQKRLAKHDDPHAFRDENNVCHLPKNLLIHILGLAMKERQMRVMSEWQRDAVLDWGLRRETLTTGMWMKEESFRVWVLLDCIKCIEYAQ